ncbi:MAG TPA: PsiF family protein [Roseiarcus sp.]|nr:PsiF family protein [Roseiarcus sp.]
MKLSLLAPGVALAMALAAGAALAQNTTPAPATPAPAATAPATTAPATTAPAGTMTTTTPADKAAKSAECSKEADAKGLHGAARKKFRAECKKGKM